MNNLPASSQACILVVDDHPGHVRLTKKTLELNQYNVITAENSRQAIAKIVAEEPDLVILDISMPNVDGYETCLRIRQFSTCTDYYVDCFVR